MPGPDQAHPADRSPWADPERARVGFERLTRRAQADGTREELRRARLELAIYKAAGREGADAGMLLRSRTFVLAVRDLDPDAEDVMRTLARAIRSALRDDPRLAAS